ncbi:pyruvate formate lyase family protein [Diplocloster agilis]|uniref:pyruvate formate lyase family protein n=1 Tax=Diplocloster agilis TaxID=2850323 RepID=UPI000820BAF7|nr:pyruvate formate lyase family protein [Suonthocola fibrivorans]MCU6736126.1 hypothetical protein [Suonthocola fibrivorans]SCJ86674.1 4-hydroxyphenylacetate decarboxylase large subunit [uncultured Clostridium sp.]
MASDFATHREAILEEYEEYYRDCPYDVTPVKEILDQWYEEAKDRTPYERKALVYRAAAQLCEIRIFRQSPFFFEVKTGRIRNSSQNGFPPGPGLEGWYMDKQMHYAEEFQEWIRPYRERDLIWGDIFSDLAHHSVGYDNLLAKGLKGFVQKAREQMEKQPSPAALGFYRSVIEGCEALRQIAGRFSALAQELLAGEQDQELRDNLSMIREAAKRVPWEPAESFYEALCVILFFKEMMTGLEGVAVAVLGHLDRLLEPYYIRDCERGELDYEKAKNLMAHFLIHTDARWDLTGDEFASTNNSLIIGGCDQEGNVIYNDITRMILEVYDEYELVNPKIQARISSRHPEEYFSRTAAMIAGGKNVFSFLNDDVIIASNVRMGKDLKDARLYSAGGCQEPVLDNTELNCRAFLYLSLPQLVNSFFDDSLNLFFEREDTGYEKPEHLENFEEFYENYIAKLESIYKRLVEVLNHYGAFMREFDPCPLLSATLTGCLEKGIDMTEGGAIYNPTSMPLVGIGTAINSLLAIKEVVYDKHMLSLKELGALLQSNFEADPRMREYLLNRCPKYGMDTPEVNAFAGRIFHDLATATSGPVNNRGGRYEASLFVFYLFDWMKEQVGATSDGRLAGTALSRGMNPTDISGISNTANILHTLKKIDMTDYPGAGVLYLEMPLMKSEPGTSYLARTMKAFLEAGGSALDLNLLDPQVLKKARENPDAYKNIVVRVCGFSAYFTSLDTHIQDEIIGRTFVNG